MTLVMLWMMMTWSNVSAIGVLLFLTTSKACSQNLMKLAFLWLFVDMDLF